MKTSKKASLLITLAILLTLAPVFPQKRGSQPAKALVNAGDKLLDERKWSEAIDAYNSALQIDPQNADAYIGLGDAHLGTGRWSNALEAYKKAVALAPRNADAHYALGAAYNTMRMHGDAFAPLVKATQLDPAYAEAFYGIGYAYLSGGQYEKSLSFFKRAIALNPGYEDAHYGLALAHLHLGNQQGYDDERKKLVALNSVFVKRLDVEVSKLKGTPNETPTAVTVVETPAPALSDPKQTRPRRSFASDSSVNVTGRRPELVIVTGHSSPIGAVAFSPDGQLFATGDGGGAIKLWNTKTGAGLRTLVDQHTLANNPAVAALAFSADGKMLAAALLTEPLEGTKDTNTTSEIRVWEIASGQVLRTLSAGNIHLKAIAFSPDGRSLVSGGLSNVVTLWDLTSGRPSRTFIGRSQIVNSVMFVPDGSHVASGSWDSAADFWSVTDAAPPRQAPTFPLSTSPLVPVVFNPAARRLASIPFLDFKKIIVTESSTMRIIREIPAEGVSSLAFNSSGKILACGTNTGDVRLWDTDSGNELLTINGTPANDLIAMSPNNTMIAQVSESESIRLWDVSNQTTFNVLAGHTDDVNYISFSPTGSVLASSSWDETVRLWDLKTSDVKVLTGHTDRPGPLAFSPDGKVLASIADNIDNFGEAFDDKTIRLWEVETGKELGNLTDEAVPLAISFSPDGSALVIGRFNGTIALLDTTGKSQPRILNAGNLPVMSITFISPDVFQTLSMSEDETVVGLHLWELSTGKLQKSSTLTVEETVNSTEQFFMGNIGFIAISPQFYAMPVKGNGISLFRRKTTEINPTSETELATIYLLNNDEWIITTPDGLFDGSPGAWSTLRWRFNNDTFDTNPIESFFEDFYYPGLLTDVLAGKQPTAKSDIATKDRRQPQLKLTTPDSSSGGSSSERNLRVQIDVSEAPAGAQDVRLFRNGSLVKAWRGDVLKGQKSVSLTTTIPIVAGKNDLVAYVFNRDNIKSADATLTINGAATLARKRIAYVFAVGVNKYANSEFNLRYAVADAQAFSDELKRQQGKLNNFDRVEVISLSDQEATKANILRSLNSLTGKIQPEDAIFIFFAGHGAAYENHFYLVPHDLGYTGSRLQITQAGLQTIIANSISDKELERALETIDAGQILFVLDACYSGQALEAEEKRRGPMNNKGLAQLAYEKGMYILTAAQSYQAAHEAARLGHGYLTYALVEEALRTNAADVRPRDGQVLVREWLDYATRRVPDMQQRELDEQSKQGRSLERIKFTEADTGETRTLQHPRVFYRREAELHPFVISITDGSSVTSSSAPNVGEAAFWKQIENSTDPTDFEEYLKSYPNGVFAPVARLKSRKLRESSRASVLPEPTVKTVTYETIEGNYQRGLMLEVINDARTFLTTQPDNARVNVMLGFALLSQQNETEGFHYLAKGFLGGETITINVKRHRYVGAILRDGVITIHLNGISMRYDDEQYHAPFSEISNFEARNYGQSGIGILVKGRFTNAKGKQENKDFNLFATTAVVSQLPGLYGSTPIVSCYACETWSTFHVRLFHHLRSAAGSRSQ